SENPILLAITPTSSGPDVRVDAVAPTLLNATISPAGTYIAGQSIQISLTYSESVVVSGTPQIPVTLASGATSAVYLSGSGTATLTFQLTFVSGQSSPQGIAVSSTVNLAGGSIKDLAGLNAPNSFPPVSGAGIIVKATHPTVLSAQVPTAGFYKAGSRLNLVIQFSEPVTASGGVPRIPLTIGSSTVYATLASTAGSLLTFTYEVQAGQTDNDGIAIGSFIELNGAVVRDLLGNSVLSSVQQGTSVIPLPTLGSTAGVKVDTTAPSVISVLRHSPTMSIIDAPQAVVRLTFSEPVSLSKTDLALTADQLQADVISIVSAGTATYDVTVGNFVGIGSLRVDVTPSLKDIAGNPLASAFTTGESYRITGNGRPAVTSTLVQNAKLGTPFSYTITATNQPTQFFATNLPTGLSLDAETGIISGTISTPGAFTLGLSAANTLGTGQVASLRLTFSSMNLPVIVTQPASLSILEGANATFSVTATSASALTYQWFKDGLLIPDATQASLQIVGVHSLDAGLYSVQVSNTDGTVISSAALLGVQTETKVSGDAVEVGSNIVHPNGNVYDQSLLTGHSTTLVANPGQIHRVSFVDLSNDIVQIEFSGAGSLTLTLEAPTGPATAALYVQPEVQYMKGHPSIIIADANETTHLAVFSVGRSTAVNQSLFRDDVVYDGVADLASIAIASINGKFGSLRAGNVTFFASHGITGIYAPNIQFTGPVYVGDINAYVTAQPTLLLGSATDVRITGGDLLQNNQQPVAVSGITALQFTAGSNSHGVSLPNRPTSVAWFRTAATSPLKLSAK
ncbi:MAG TPA: immunoglobulin domain-containing protein, partial [Opitutaceae bacterium]|nr:immunoglobulin domain-containing protein [Opitutaceae bacterium]